MADKMLSYSQLTKWLQCRYSWFLGYDYKGTGLQATTGPAASFGKAVHAGLEEVFKLRSHWEAGLQSLPTKADALWGVQKEEADPETAERAATTAYMAYRQFPWDKYRVYVDAEGPYLERHLIAPLPGWDGFQGFIDAIVQDRETGALWIVDHKTRSRFASSRDMESDLQLTLYKYLAAANGLQVAGVAYNEIRSDIADRYDLDTAGKLLPRSKRSTSDPIRFSRHYRGDTEAANAWERIVEPAALEMQICSGEAETEGENTTLEPSTLMYPRSLTPSICGRCDFRELCYEGLRGGDAEFLADIKYTAKAS